MPTFSPSRVGIDANLHAEYTGFPITPSDSTDVPTVPGLACYGFAVTGAGNVSAQTTAGVAVTFTSVPAGAVIDAGIKRILATSTTATGLNALYRPRER